MNCQKTRIHLRYNKYKVVIFKLFFKMRKPKSSHQLTPSLNAQPAALKARRGPWLQALLPPGTGKQHQVTVGAVAATTTRTPAANAARRSRLNRSPTTWLASCRRALSLSATIAGPLHVACTCMHACGTRARARARTRYLRLYYTVPLPTLTTLLRFLH